MSDDLARVPDQNCEEAIFDGCQMNLFILQKYLTTRKVDTQLIQCEYGFLLPGVLQCLMADCNSYPGEEFPCAEWFGEVIIGAGVKGLDFVLLLFSCRNDNDRDPTLFTESSCNLDPVHVGQPQVEQNHVRIACCGLHQALFTGRRLDKAIAVALQGDPQKAPHLRLIFDQEDQFLIL